MNCRTEFGPEYAIPADLLNVLLASGWEDTSWHNDACPTFHHDERALELICDSERVADREFGSRFPRFGVYAIVDGLPDAAAVFSSEDVPALLTYLATLEG